MKFVPNVLSVKAARTVLVSQKHSPQVLFAAGIIGVGATVVLACRATLKVEEVLEKTEQSLTDVREVRARSLEMGGTTLYSEHDVKKDKAYIYIRAAADLSKLYGPAIICGVVSVSALAGSHNILSKRNAALASAYGALQKTFGEYRDRVAASVGREKEEELYYDVEACEIDDAETGKKVKTKLASGKGGSPYARLFDEYNKNWEPTPEYNFLFLKLQQKYANQLLQSRGHVFLNEIYDALGLERSKEGAVVGWIKGGADDYIDFGIFEDRMEERIVDFMVGREKSIWLDFNVDGIIYDKI